MRKQYNLLMGWLFILLCVGCTEDLGNYKYGTLNDVSIVFDDNLSALVLEPLQVTPELSANPFHEEAYTYDWKAYPKNETLAPILLSEERNLNVEITLDPGLYNLVYTVTEKATGLFARQTASLLVETPLSRGWVVLGDADNRVRLDMYSEVKQKVYADLLKGTELADWKQPKSIQFVLNQSIAESPFYLLTGSGATRLSSHDFAFKEEYRFAYELGSFSGAEVIPDVLGINGTGKMVIASGKPYYCDNTMGDGLFGAPRKNSYDVAPFIGCDALSDHYAPTFLMYDTTNKRFVVCAEQFSVNDVLGYPMASDVALSSLGSYGFPVGEENLFELPAAGMYDLVTMQNTAYDPGNRGFGTTYTVLAKDNQRVLYGFALGDLVSIRYPEKYGSVYTKILYRDLSACTDIDKATLFAFSSLKNYMYYAVKGAVYRVDLNVQACTAELQFTLPNEEEITCLKFYACTQADNARRSYDLIVGSRTHETTDSPGVLRIYDGWKTEGNFLNAQPSEEYKGFAVIKDVLYREMITSYE